MYAFKVNNISRQCSVVNYIKGNVAPLCLLYIIFYHTANRFRGIAFGKSSVHRTLISFRHYFRFSHFYKFNAQDINHVII
jgi:hypothetical protein